MKRFFPYILFAVVMLIFASCGAGRSPRSAAKHFYKAIANEEFDKALAYSTLEEGADAEIYYAIMDKAAQSIAERGGVKSIEIVEEQIAEDGLSATVTTAITYADGSVQSEICDVVLHENKWVVDVNLNSK